MRYIFSWYVIGVYSFFIVIVSILPVKAPVQLIFPFSDKVFHGLTYVILSFVTVNTLYLTKQRYPKLCSFSYAFILGLSIEICQFFLPFRELEIADITANLLGSFLGCLLKII